MGRIKILVAAISMLTVALTMLPTVAGAQGNYVPMDYYSLPRMPGCDWWPDPNYAGMYQAWCGSDEVGWYRPTEWGQMYGMNPGDYGYGG
jgi:hypothetical protein